MLKHTPVPPDPRDLEQSGFKSGAAEFIHSVLSLDQRFNPLPPDTHFFRVRGDTLRLLALRHGDLLLVDTALPPLPSDLALCILDGRVTVRRLRRVEGQVVPVPLRGEVMGEWRVWGVVRSVVREMKRR